MKYLLITLSLIVLFASLTPAQSRVTHPKKTIAPTNKPAIRTTYDKFRGETTVSTRLTLANSTLIAIIYVISNPKMENPPMIRSLADGKRYFEVRFVNERPYLLYPLGLTLLIDGKRIEASLEGQVVWGVKDSNSFVFTRELLQRIVDSKLTEGQVEVSEFTVTDANKHQIQEMLDFEIE